jgi:phosphate:Na+ symporter
MNSLLAEITPESLPLGAIFMGLFGGLALFLYGMEKMSEALKLVAGSGMKKILSKLTTNRFTGVLAGGVVTAIIQSSSVTTVLVVGFISAGLMTLAQSTGVIMGANVGTTITAQIIAFNVTKYALLLVGIGFSMQFFVKKEKIQHYGRIIMGLGLIFFGMQLMGDGTKPLRTYQPFIDMMGSMSNPFLGILLGAVFTALVQSSSATTGIVIVLASNGLITLESGIALVLGSNVGTCVTAMLASIGKPREAVRAAVVHVIFNLAGVLLWIGLIGWLGDLAREISPKYPNLQSAQRLAAESPRQIANAHTLFNVLNTFIFIWFVNPINWLACKIIPTSRKGQTEEALPNHLDDLLLQTPSLALEVIRLEVAKLGTMAVGIVHSAFDKIIRGKEPDLAKIESTEVRMEQLQANLVTYIGRLSKESLTEEQHLELQDYLAVANYIDNITGMIETNLLAVGRKRLKAGMEISQHTEKLIIDFHKKVAESVELAIRALVDNNPSLALQVIDAKKEINRLATEVENHLTRRLAADEPGRFVAFRLESKLMEYLRRMYYFAKRIAKIVGEKPQTLTDHPEDKEVSDIKDSNESPPLVRKSE